MWLFSLSYPLSATVAEIGRISDALMSRDGKSFVSCLVGARLILIAHILHISNGTINRDISYIRQQAKSNIRRYIDERLPEEYEKCLVGLTAILREAWNTSQHTEDRREKIQALALAKDCYSMKLDLLTNATVGEKMKKNQENLTVLNTKIS